jgi:hypothetical protein
MRDELRDRPSEMTFAERDHSVEALLLDRPYEALRVGSTTILRTDHMVTPRKIRVRLRWEDGHIDTLPEPINSNKFELKQQDSTGAWHSFDDANEVDEEGYLIFAQVD